MLSGDENENIWMESISPAYELIFNSIFLHHLPITKAFTREQVALIKAPMSRIHEMKKGLGLIWNPLIKQAEGYNLPALSVLGKKK